MLSIKLKFLNLTMAGQFLFTDGLHGASNATGDEQKKLDVLSNEMLVNALYNSHACAILVSEENEEPIIVPDHMAGKYERCVH